ncbi:MAG: iron ABC transporter permease [Actinomycetota bacterium]|nr:iron ABC transporter permease [Actinomycetota bacterium]
MDRHRPSLTGIRSAAPPTLALAFLGALVVWPIVAILVRSLGGVGSPRLAEILGRDAVWSVAGFTVFQAALSTVMTLALGFPVALGLARYELPGRRLIRSLVVVPFVLPTVVVAASFRAVFGAFGVFEQSLFAILAAHVFFNLAVVVRVLGGAWSRIDARQADAARVLGASSWQTFRRVTFPVLRGPLAASATIVFLFCFTSYGVILMLGGPTRATLETEIQRYAVFRQEFDVAAVLALLQMCVVALLAIAAGRWQRRAPAAGLSSARTLRRRRLPIDSGPSRVLGVMVLVIVGVVIVLPMVALVERSLRVGDGHGFDHFVRLAERSDVLPVSPLRALLHSLAFASVAAAIAVACAVVTARSIARGGRLGRLVGLVSLVPLGVSAVTLGFGYLVGFARFDLRRSLWLIPAAHAVIGLPFVLATIMPAITSIPERLRQAAAGLGASPREVTRRIERPIVRRAVLSGAGFAVAVSVGEFGATSFLARGASGFTAPLAVFRLLSRPGDTLRGQALALSVIIGLIVGSLALVLDRVGEAE